MESRTIQLTPAAHKYGNLNLRSCGRDFFPPDVFGGPSKKAGLGVPITLKVEGLPNPIQTDIPTSNKTGKPRWIFRQRKWLKNFIRCHKLKANDMITIDRLDKRTYKLSPNNHRSQVVEKEHKTNTHRTTATLSPTSKIPNKLIDIGYTRTCNCPKNHINCLTAKDWIRNQVAIWELYYEKRDIRDKDIHPAAFPIALPKKCIELFTHTGELVIDPFVGIGTTLIAARDLGRNAVGFDLNKKYIDFSNKRGV